MIEHKREIRELHEIVSAKGDDVTSMLEAQQALRLRITEIGAALDRARNEAHQGELALVTAEKDLRRAEEQLTQATRRRGTVEGELEELCEALDIATASTKTRRLRSRPGAPRARKRAPGWSTPRCSRPSGASACSGSSRW
jgi:chromosome segregation protein